MPPRSARPDPPPTPPREPDLEECCGQGCDPCVFDLFEAARQRYLEQLKAWQARQRPAPSASRSRD
jgi:hypothetical protein